MDDTGSTGDAGEQQRTLTERAWHTWHDAEVAYGNELGRHVAKGWSTETPMQVPGKSLNREALERLASLRAEAQTRMDEYARTLG
jgi:hypothetical protein